jgi:hypothetical protein
MRPASRPRAAPNRLEENSLPAFMDPILFRDFGPIMLAVRCLLAILCGGILVVVAIMALLRR